MYKNVNGKRVELSAKEEEAILAEWEENKRQKIVDKKEQLDRDVAKSLPKINLLIKKGWTASEIELIFPELKESLYISGKIKTRRGKGAKI